MMMLTIACRVLWIATFSGLVQTHSVTNPPITQFGDYKGSIPNRFYLPDTIDPQIHYVLLHPNATSKTFTGRVFIQMTLTQDMNFTMVNMRGLNISAIRVLKEVNRTRHAVALTAAVENEWKHQLYVKFNETLEVDTRIAVDISFSGVINKAWRGMYYKSYFSGGEERLTIFTNGDTTEIFPCVYRVRHKSEIKLYLVHEPNKTVLSNSPSTTSDYTKDVVSLWSFPDGYFTPFQHLKVSVFESIRLRMHAFSLVLGEFSYRSKNCSHHEVRVYAPPNQINMSDFALNKTVEILEYYFTYLDSTWETESHDTLNIVSAGNVGGYSTDGLIFMSGANLAYQPGISPPGWEQKTTFELAYHLARLWFGNKVVTDKEEWFYALDGLAGYVASRAMTDLYGSQDTTERYDQWYEKVLEEDSLYSTRAVNDVTQLYLFHRNPFEPFDFQKGALIMKMIESRVSTDNMRSALRTLAKSDNNLRLEEKEFFQRFFLNKETPLSEGERDEFSYNWFQLNGYPVVTLSRDGNTVSYTQKRFVINSRWLREREQTRTLERDFQIPHREQRMNRWIIPFTYTTSADPEGQTLIWLTEKSGTFTVNASSVTWIKGKIEPHSLYRVNYDSSGWKDLQDMITRNHSELPAVQRKSLFSDAFALARAGYLSYCTLLNMTGYVVNETDQSVRDEVVKGLTTIRDTMDGTFRITGDFPYKIEDHRGVVSEYMKSLDLQPLNKTQCACKSSGDAENLYKQWLRDPNTEIPADMTEKVYSYGVMEGERKGWDMVFYRSTQTNKPIDKLMMQTALACSPRTIHLERLVKYCLNTSLIDTAHVHAILEKMVCSGNGRIVAFRFLEQHWNDLVQMFGGVASPLLQPMARAMHGFQSQADLDELSQFFYTKTHYWTAVHRSRQQALEEVQNRLDWRSDFTRVVITWLEDSGRCLTTASPDTIVDISKLDLDWVRSLIAVMDRQG